MKGVIATRAPEAVVVDVTHGIPPHAVLVGALVLQQAVPYFPLGTVHVGVVDPGVGTERRALCIVTHAGCFVGPDNGLLSLAADTAGIRRIVELTDERFFISPRSATFHGRDVFAPVAAAVAAGTPATAFGPECTDLLRLHLPEPVRDGSAVRGEVIYVDHFGNLISNLTPETFPSGKFVVSVEGTRVGGPVTTYGDVAPGTTAALVSSFGLLEIAVRDGSAHDVLGHGAGSAVVLTPENGG
jgi:S-adenosylmethionine hydrolase